MTAEQHPDLTDCPTLAAWQVEWGGWHRLTDEEQTLLLPAVEWFVEQLVPEGPAHLTVIVDYSQNIAARPDFGGEDAAERREVLDALGGPGRRVLVVVATDATSVPIIEIWGVENACDGVLAQQVLDALSGGN